MTLLTKSLLKSADILMRRGGVNPDDPRNAAMIADAWRNAKPEHWRQLALVSGLPMLFETHRVRFLEALEGRVS